MVEREFVRPTFSDDPDVEAYVSACPAGFSTRGTFFQGVVGQVEAKIGHVPERLFEQVSRRSWVPFGSYPLREFMRLAVASAQIMYPNSTLSEGLRRVGSGAFTRLAETMAGRVLLFAFGERAEQVVMSAPKAYGQALPGCSARVQRLGEDHVRIELRRVYCFIGCYHYGVLEGAIKALGHVPELRVRLLDRPCDADFDLSWK